MYTPPPRLFFRGHPFLVEIPFFHENALTNNRGWWIQPVAPADSLAPSSQLAVFGRRLESVVRGAGRLRQRQLAHLKRQKPFATWRKPEVGGGGTPE